MGSGVFSGEKYLKMILDAFPSPVLIVDRNLQIYDFNRAAADLVGKKPDILLRRLCGDLLQCIHAKRSKGGCGTTEHCKDCVLRQTAEAVTEGKSTTRRLAEMSIEKKGQTQEVWFMVSGSLLEYEGQKLALISLEDVTELIELRSMIPICSHCRKVRDDKNFWQSVEEYFVNHTQINFTHSICPECAQKHYSDFGF